MRVVILLLALFFCCGFLKAQDIIIKRDKKEILGVVSKVTATEIHYKDAENANGPILKIPVSEVYMIDYENGSRQGFTKEAKDEIEADRTPAKEAEYGRHMVAVHPFQVALDKIMFSYELFSKTDKTGIRITARGGYKDTFYELGVDVKNYLTKSNPSDYSLGKFYLGQLDIRYFLGPSVLFLKDKEDSAFGARFINGVSFQHYKGYNFTVYGYGGAEFLVSDQGAKSTAPVAPIYGFQFGFGWRF